MDRRYSHFLSLSSHLLFKLVTSTVAYGLYTEMIHGQKIFTFFNSLSSHLLFKLVTSTGTYGWLFWTVFQSISSRLPYRQSGASVARLSDVLLN